MVLRGRRQDEESSRLIPTTTFFRAGNDPHFGNAAQEAPNPTTDKL